MEGSNTKINNVQTRRIVGRLFLYSGVLILMRSYCRIFSLPASDVKFLLPWAPDFYTPLVLERAVNVYVVILPSSTGGV